MEKKQEDTEFHKIGYAVKKYISRHHGCTKVEGLNSAWHMLPRGKDIYTFLEEFPATTNSICKSQRGKKEHGTFWQLQAHYQGWSYTGYMRE